MKKRLIFFIAFLLAGTHQFAYSATLNISNVPLYLGGSVEPNVMFTLDDSGSMQFEVMPDENRNYTSYVFPAPSNVYGGATYTNQLPNFDDNNVHNFFTRSSANNAVFYNPDITYEPWSNADGTSMGNANPRAARYNPVDASRGTMDLLSQQSQYACWYQSSSLGSAYGDPCYGYHSFWPITYYIYSGNGTPSSRSNRNNYERVRITNSTSNSATFISPGGITRNKAEEVQNFANWFQYYRSRILTARAGVGRAFAKQSTNLRVGFGAINQGSRSVDNVTSDRSVITGVRSFSGTNRSTFFDNLYERTINNSGTPLRSAANSVGEYFERSDNRGPWGNTPGSNDSSAHLTCRQSYHILTTDGYWNGSNPNVGNADGTAGSVITGPNNDNYQYTPRAPYSDSWTNTLADVAMHYWKRDLRTNLDNKVPTNQNDPAFWQHLVTFTVGLGVDGTLDQSDYDDLVSGAKSWPQPSSDSERNIDDLWHAAVNSRGEFFSAADPDTFAESLSAILSNIASRTSSSASVALNAGSASGERKAYQARFDSGNWTGQLRAYNINEDTGAIGNIAWDAGNLIPAYNQRKIITSNAGVGRPFRWDNITNAQKALLNNNSNILNYLRGNAALEARNGGTYRNRTRLLGDIINSAPTYVAAPASRYRDFWGTGQPENSALYSTFVTSNKNRTGMVYVGANDGMLHGFNAETGVEQFAFVPSSVYDNLKNLTATNYTHRFFVDGSPNVVDAFINGSWKTILVSGLGAGGQGIFALDVTNPSNFTLNSATESSISQNVLWEFTDDNDRDLGYTFGQVSVIRLNNGQWAALFSGGYNNNDDNGLDGSNSDDSITGNGSIYLVNLATGALIKKFDTQRGLSQDPTNQNRPNGLSSPTAVDINNDGSVDYIYSGDLFGNVWKIDVSSSTPSNWKFAYQSGANSPTPLYQACSDTPCTSTNRQPITTRIQVVQHPTSNGYLLLFGTGKYFEVGDNASAGQTTQSFYAIWDKNLSTLTNFNRSNLLAQQILDENAFSSSNTYRVTSNYAINWSQKMGWYIDLKVGSSSNNGERQVSDAIVRNGRIIFTTLIPSTDPCEYGGTGWLMELNYINGSRLSYSPFDVNNTGTITAQDLRSLTNAYDSDGNCTANCVAVSGRKSNIGIIARPTISPLDGETEMKYVSGADGNISAILENTGTQARQSWRQLDY